MYLSNRALIALMSIPELLRRRVLFGMIVELSRGVAEEIGTRCTWVGWESIATDLERLDREFEREGNSGSSNSSTWASRA